jgi:hypothetical protein
MVGLAKHYRQYLDQLTQEEIRAYVLELQYAARFNYGLAAIFRDLQERQDRGEFTVVTRKPRRPIVRPPAQKRRAV